jgi:hypothetical protein
MDKDIREYADFILSMKHWFTCVSIDEKIKNGRGTGEPCLRIGVVQKMRKPDYWGILADQDTFETLFQEWKERGKPQEFNTMPPVIPSKIKNMKTDIIQTGRFDALTEVPRHQSYEPPTPDAGENNRKKWRPTIPAGASMIADGSTACTFTAWAKDKATGKYRMIVANHCGLIANQCQTVPVGYAWVQPSPMDGGTSADHVAKRGPEQADPKDPYVDALPLDPDRQDYFTKEIVDLGTIEGKALDPKVNEAIYKSGRTTGTGQSPIFSASTDVNINYGACGTLTKKDCIIANTIGLQGGDSGDPATVVRNGKRLIVGQWNAGSAYGMGVAMKIQHIEEKYNCDFDISQPTPPPEAQLEYSVDDGAWQTAKTVNVRAKQATPQPPDDQNNCFSELISKIVTALIEFLECEGFAKK